MDFVYILKNDDTDEYINSAFRNLDDCLDAAIDFERTTLQDSGEIINVSYDKVNVEDLPSWVDISLWDYLFAF